MGYRGRQKREMEFSALLPRIPRNAIFGKNADFGPQAAGEAGQQNGKISVQLAKMPPILRSSDFGKSANFL
jgi:hypothetical protein